VEEIKGILAEQSDTMELIFKHHGLKRAPPLEEEMSGGAKTMSSGMGKGLANAFGLGNLKSKKNSRLMMSMSIGSVSEDDNTGPNIDPHKILREVLQMGIQRRNLARMQGKDPNKAGFIQDDMIKKRSSTEKLVEDKKDLAGDKKQSAYPTAGSIQQLKMASE